MNKTGFKIKVIASFLAAVFLVVFVARGFHHHDLKSPHDVFASKGQGGKSDDCSICNYHITKDIDFPSTEFNFGIIPSFSQPVFFYLNRSVSSPAIIYADRGPPSVI